VPADVAADLARRAGSRNLFSAQRQDGLQSLYLDFVNHVLHDLAGAFDQVDQRQQDLSVGLAELLDDGGGFLGGTRHNMVRFLHGGWLLFQGLVWQPDSIETGATAVTNLQLRLGHPPARQRTPLSAPEHRDFREICEDRYLARSTILTSQPPVWRWHEQIGDPPLADGILDRLVHNAHRIEMRGDSMRKSRGKQSG
jgi:hypothetical protein